MDLGAKILDLEATNRCMDKLKINSTSVAGFRVDDAHKAPAAILLWTAPVGASGREVWDEEVYGGRHGTWSDFIMLAATTAAFVSGCCIIGWQCVKRRRKSERNETRDVAYVPEAACEAETTKC